MSISRYSTLHRRRDRRQQEEDLANDSPIRRRKLGGEHNNDHDIDAQAALGGIGDDEEQYEDLPSPPLSTEQPPRRNMANGPDCYYFLVRLHSLHNTPEIRSIFHADNSFPFIDLDDKPTKTRIHQGFIRILRSLFAELDVRDSAIPVHMTTKVMNVLAKLDPEFFKRGATNDSTIAILKMLEAIQRSTNLYASSENVNTIDTSYSEEQDARIKKGDPIMSLLDDIHQRFLLSQQLGYNSTFVSKVFMMVT